jgi:hypothetical protein
MPRAPKYVYSTLEEAKANEPKAGKTKGRFKLYRVSDPVCDPEGAERVLFVWERNHQMALGRAGAKFGLQVDLAEPRPETDFSGDVDLEKFVKELFARGPEYAAQLEAMVKRAEKARKKKGK